MDGSGLKDILETIHGENTVVHTCMMNGKAVQRAFRGHLLVSECLTQKIIAKITEDEPGFENHILELEKIYSAVENEKIDLDTLSNTSCITEITKALDSKKDELSSWSETSKLWLNYMYQRMIKVAMMLIKVDRTGSWQMHL